MTVRWFHMLGALALVVCATTANALAASSPTIESTPIPNPAKPNFSAMNFQLGTWTCSSQSSRRPAPYITTSVTTIDPSGYWMVTKSETAKTSWAPAALATDWVTYDADTHRWVDINTGDYGGYGATTSPGWNGNTIVWTDPLFKAGMDAMAVTPTTTTKDSDTKTTSHTTFQEKNSGRWISVDTVCTKNG
ncbi:MAG: hypothetical protein M3Z54_11790 [Gemmatimonadota bacterium]|nr:hypothetical protein [Gemmatimonadota bacterium]